MCRVISKNIPNVPFCRLNGRSQFYSRFFPHLEKKDALFAEIRYKFSLRLVRSFLLFSWIPVKHDAYLFGIYFVQMHPGN